MLRAPAPDRSGDGTVPGRIQAAEFSDRMVVAVAAVARWFPGEGRYLNDAELYAVAG